MLMKLTQGVNFINILRGRCLYKSALHSFSLVTFWLLQKYESTSVQETQLKMLMKLTPGDHDLRIRTIRLLEIGPGFEEIRIQSAF